MISNVKRDEDDDDDGIYGLSLLKDILPLLWLLSLCPLLEKQNLTKLLYVIDFYKSVKDLM